MTPEEYKQETTIYKLYVPSKPFLTGFRLTILFTPRSRPVIL